jgi:hypothetical protein
MKINDPGGGANLDPRAIICTILQDVHYTAFHAKYLTPAFVNLEKMIFLSFYFILIRKT